MAEVFAPFPIQRTMCNLTFYMMEGRNFVRKKSSLTRRKVLYSPQFARTRHNAALMATAAKLGSAVYNALPEYWRQGWMYRSFTGEAYKMIKAGIKEAEIKQVLLKRYVEPVICKQTDSAAIAALPVQPKRAYRKQNADYWRGKTIKSKRRKAHKQKVLYNAGILGRASKIGSALYARIPLRYRRRSCYRQLTAWAMQLLREGWEETDILAGFLTPPAKARPELCYPPKAPKAGAGVIVHPNGQFYFITSGYIRFETAHANVLQVMTGTIYDPALTPACTVIKYSSRL